MTLGPPTFWWHQPSRALTIRAWGVADGPGALRVGGARFADTTPSLFSPLAWSIESAGDHRCGRADHASGEPLPAVPAPSTPANDYADLVRHALKAIDVGEVDKVVVARAERMDHRPDVPTLLDTLARRFPECTVYALRHGRRTFVGASPESLVRVIDGRVETAAIAGTGRDPEALLASAKDRDEHAFVVDHIRSALRDAGVALDPESPTVAVPHGDLHHLRTPITGRADVDVVDLAAALHPTPAVAGTPPDRARAWLADHEGFDRGWYSGAIGWADERGNGELCVAIRSAVVDDDGCTLFAGSGIVSGSDPEAERAETALKMRWMRQAILAS